MQYQLKTNKSRFPKKTLSFFILVTLLSSFGWGGYEIRKELEQKGCFSLEVDIFPIHIPLQDNNIIRFIALGDTGTGNQDQKQVAEGIRRVCNESGCDFMVLLGDNFYPNGVTHPNDSQFDVAFKNVYASIEKPFVAILGNHDTKGSVSSQVFYSLKNAQWLMPNYNYQFTAGPVQFFALNSQCHLMAFRDLNDGLKNDLAPWKFVLAHHPIYSSGTHGDMDVVMRNIWDYWFSDRVNFFLSGHDHELEHLQRDSINYVVSGAGGKHYRNPKERENTTQSEAMSRFVFQDNGFVWFEIDSQQVQMRFFDAEAKELYSYQQTLFSQKID